MIPSNPTEAPETFWRRHRIAVRVLAVLFGFGQVYPAVDRLQDGDIVIGVIRIVVGVLLGALWWWLTSRRGAEQQARSATRSRR